MSLSDALDRLRISAEVGTAGRGDTYATVRRSDLRLILQQFDILNALAREDPKSNEEHTHLCSGPRSQTG